MRQLAGGPIGRAGGASAARFFITVVGYQVGGNNSKAELRELAAHTLAEFYSHVMNWFDPTGAHAVPRSVALRDQVYAPQGITRESCVIGG
jgi:hypothetical protein